MNTEERIARFLETSVQYLIGDPTPPHTAVRQGSSMVCQGTGEELRTGFFQEVQLRAA